MDSVKPSAVAPSKSKLARTFAKVLHLRALSGIVPDDGIHKVKVKSSDDRKTGTRVGSLAHSFEDKKTEEAEKVANLEAMLAKLFASISTVKASYAQLQFAQSPYDVDGIHEADQTVVAELKNLSEMKQSYVKKQFDELSEDVLVLAEIQEHRSLLKTYEVMGKKLEAQAKSKESEIEALKEKLEEAKGHNKMIEKRLSQSGQLFMLDNLYLSGLSPKHFNTVLRHTVKSIRSFVRIMIEEMKSANWDIDAAASSIQPGVVYWNQDHKCFAFESFVCREMFDGFNFPSFNLDNESKKRNQSQFFFERFRELKSMKPKDYLTQNPDSTFSRFCRAKYLRLVHPKMESAFFGDLNQRNLVNAGHKFPETSFFASFADIAKRVWLLHCLAFSFQPEASIFTISRGNRFSEVYMESVADESISGEDSTIESDPRVGFTVVPGFRIGKTVLQAQVYLSELL